MRVPKAITRRATATKDSKMATAKMGLIGLAATAIVAKARGVLNKLASNVLYPTPVPPLDEFNDHIEALAAANADVKMNGGKAEYQARRETLAVVKSDLKTLMAYVQATSKGDGSKILTSGFELVKRSTPRGELHPPTSLRSYYTTMEKRVSMRWVAQKGADTYHVFRSNTQEPFKWELVGTTTKRSFNADNLVSGVQYWFAVSAVSAAGETSKSEPLLARAA